MDVREKRGLALRLSSPLTLSAILGHKRGIRLMPVLRTPGVPQVVQRPHWPKAEDAVTQWDAISARCASVQHPEGEASLLTALFTVT